MTLTELRQKVKDSIVEAFPNIGMECDVDKLIELVCNLPVKLTLDDLDARLAFGGAYISTVADLRSDLLIEA